MQDELLPKDNFSTELQSKIICEAVPRFGTIYSWDNTSGILIVGEHQIYIQ